VAAVKRIALALVLALALVAAPLSTASSAEAVSTIRVQGADRFATAVEVSKWTEGWAAPRGTVYLASGLKFPDALAAAPVVAAEGGHLLLTRPEAVDATTMARIEAIDPATIVIVGSEASISANVATQLEAATDAQVERLGGRDRVETSLLLLERLASQGPVTNVWVASGHTFPDALVAASVAGRDRGAIVLDYHDGTTAGASAWLDRVRGVVQGIPVRIAGGTPSVSAADEAALRGAGPLSVDRYAGADRFLTAIEINRAFAPTSPSDPTMLVATGENFPDALAGAVHAALRKAPMFLSPGGCQDDRADILRGEALGRGIQTIMGLGSAASLTDPAMSLGPCPVFTPLQASMGAEYGTFAPRWYAGSGSRTIDLGASLPTGIVRMTFADAGQHRAVTLGADGAEDELLLDQPGAYRGTVLFEGKLSPSTRSIRVTATGDWTIEVLDVRHAPDFQRSASGDSDAVFLFGASSSEVVATYSGSDTLVAWELFQQDGVFDGYLVVEMGAGTQRVPIGPGPSILSVYATDDWSLDLQ